MAVPTLLLRPEGSRDRHGAMVPTVASGVTVVAGQYGQAWTGFVSAGRAVSFPRAKYLASDNDGPFTILVRCRSAATSPGEAQAMISDTSVMTLRRGSSRLLEGVSPLLVTTTYTVADNTWGAYAYRCNGNNGGIDLFADGAMVSTPGTGGVRSSASTVTVGGLSSSQPWLGDTESVLIFGDVALPDAEISRISTMPVAWTWANVQQQPGGILPVGQPGPMGILQVG